MSKGVPLLEGIRARAVRALAVLPRRQTYTLRDGMTACILGVCLNIGLREVLRESIDNASEKVELQELTVSELPGSVETVAG